MDPGVPLKSRAGVPRPRVAKVRSWRGLQPACQPPPLRAHRSPGQLLQQSLLLLGLRSGDSGTFPSHLKRKKSALCKAWFCQTMLKTHLPPPWHAPVRQGVQEQDSFPSLRRCFCGRWSLRCWLPRTGRVGLRLRSINHRQPDTRAFLIRSPDLLWNSRHHSYVRVATAYGGNQPNNLSGTRDFYFASTMDSSLERELSHPAKTTMTLSSILG